MTTDTFRHPIVFWARREGYTDIFPYKTGGMVPRPGSTLQGVKEDLELAEDPTTNIRKLEKLYEESSSTEVKMAVLRNPNTPVAFLKEAVEMGGAKEADAVGQNPNRILGRLVMDEWLEIDGFIAMNTNSPDVLRELSQHPDPDVRKFVGARSDTPEDVRIALAADPEEMVQDLMAFEPGTLPLKAKKLLITSRFKNVREEFARQAKDKESFNLILESGDKNLLSILAFERDDVPPRVQKQADKLYPRS
jgi:hypothetical protein